MKNNLLFLLDRLQESPKTCHPQLLLSDLILQIMNSSPKNLVMKHILSVSQNDIFRRYLSFCWWSSTRSSSSAIETDNFLFFFTPRHDPKKTVFLVFFLRWHLTKNVHLSVFSHSLWWKVARLWQGHFWLVRHWQFFLVVLELSSDLLIDDTSDTHFFFDEEENLEYHDSSWKINF